MASITGKIDINGVETEFTIFQGLGWQQWGGTTEQLGGRVNILEAMVAGLADESITLEDEDEDDEESLPEPGDTIEHEGREILVQSIEPFTDDTIRVYGRYVAEDGSIDELAEVVINKADLAD